MLRVIIAGVALLVLGGNSAAAQRSADLSFVLLPVGARAVGLGEAVVAEQGGSEQVWWNAAALAWQTERELAIHHSTTFVGQGNVLAFVLPSRHLGTAALSVNVLDLGEQQATDEQGLPTGVILPRYFAYAAAYAARPAKYWTLGATYKLVQLRIDCTGQCANLPSGGARTNALDLGTQLGGGQFPLTIGVAVRNIGTRKGSSTGTVPERVDVGANYRLAFLDRYFPDVDVHTMASLVATGKLRDRSGHFGADIAWEKRVHVRAGYVTNGPDGAHTALGFGLATGSVVFDLARNLGGLSADQGKPPTYFSLRYLF